MFIAIKLYIFGKFRLFLFVYIITVEINASMLAWQPFELELRRIIPASCKLRSGIRFLCAKNTGVDIHSQQCEVYGEKCISVQHVRKWYAELKDGSTDVHDE